MAPAALNSSKDESGDFNPLESCGEKLREVKSWGGVEWDSTDFMFYGCSNLTTLPSEAPYYLSNVENMSGMFSSATNFNQDISGWNVSNVENMSGMFYGATNFNQPLDKWGKHLGYVKDMSYMFAGATNFNQPLNGWGDNLDSVEDMSYMFYGATNFNQDISGWNVSNVKDMSWMFSGAVKFVQSIDSWQLNMNVDLSNFIHINSAYEKENEAPSFCINDYRENVCLSNETYTPKESEAAQSPEPAEDE